MKRGQEGRPYCGLLGLRETAGWAGGGVFSLHATAHGEGGPWKDKLT
jgi:hypothetical protein